MKESNCKTRTDDGGFCRAVTTHHFFFFVARGYSRRFESSHVSLISFKFSPSLIKGIFSFKFKKKKNASEMAYHWVVGRQNY